VGGAFINSFSEETTAPSYPLLPPVPPQPDNHLAEQLIQIIHSCGYDSYINKNNINDIVACINASSLNDFQKGALISNFKISVDYNTSLQCVGFTQAIADAQGIFLPNCGNAKDYINCSALSGRYINEPSPGVFGVLDGQWGHIGVITAVTTNEAGNKICRFASAWGNPRHLEGGNIDIVEYPCNSFDALIKPN
jgi:hypothetical protein